MEKQSGRPRPRRTSALLAQTAAALLCCAVATPVLAAAPPRQPPDPRLSTLLKGAVVDLNFPSHFEAEVWLTDLSFRLRPHMPDANSRVHLLKQVHYEARRAQLAPELVLSVIDVESKFNRWAISSAGAQGLMQVMPFWIKEIGQPKDNLFDVPTNLRMGCTILRYYLDMENGNLTRALARYNGSLGNFWYPRLVYQALNRRWYKPL